MCAVRPHHPHTPPALGWPVQAHWRLSRHPRPLFVPSYSVSASCVRCSVRAGQAAAPEAPASLQEQPSTALQTHPGSRPSSRPRVPRQLSAEAVEQLAQESGLSDDTLQRVCAAAVQYTSVSTNAAKLLARIKALQELLGSENADLLIRTNPQMLGRRPETLAANLQLWAAFLPHLSHDQLLHKLSASPSLLAASTIKAVPNLYEQAVVLGVKREEWEAFSVRHAGLGSQLPDAIERKLRLVVRVLSSEPRSNGAADEGAPAGSTGRDSRGRDGSDGTSGSMDSNGSSSSGSDGGSGSSYGSCGSGAGKSSSGSCGTNSNNSNVSYGSDSTGRNGSNDSTESTASEANKLRNSSLDREGLSSTLAVHDAGWRQDELELLRMVQRAAQRQLRWLGLSDALLLQRLQGLQAVLQECARAADVELPSNALAKVFAKQPNLVCRPTQALHNAAAAFLQLPGLQPPHGVAMLLAMPALMECAPARVAAGWATINAVASSHSSWAMQLGKLAPSTVAGLLLKGQRRLARLAFLADSKQQCIALTSALNLSEPRFAALFPEFVRESD